MAQISLPLIVYCPTLRNCEKHRLYTEILFVWVRHHINKGIHGMIFRQLTMSCSREFLSEYPVTSGVPLLTLCTPDYQVWLFFFVIIKVWLLTPKLDSKVYVELRLCDVKCQQLNIPSCKEIIHGINLMIFNNHCTFFFFMSIVWFKCKQKEIWISKTKPTLKMA